MDMSFDSKRKNLIKYTILIYFSIFLIMVLLSIFLNNEVYLQSCPFILLFLGAYITREYTELYFEYKHEYSYFQIFFKVCLLSVIISGFFCEIILRAHFESSILLFIK